MLKLTADILAGGKAARFGGYLLLCLFLPKLLVAQPIGIEIAADSTYFSSLLEVNETRFQREFEFPWLAILDKETQGSYLQIDSISTRKQFIKSFWNRQQPNPLSPRNELLQTFLHRWHYVKQHFSISSPPFFDDRGKLFLKYGEPSLRYEDSGGRKTVSLFKDRQYYQSLSRLYHGFPPAVEYFVYPNESWVYRNLGPDVVFHFVKQGERFEEVSSLTRAIEGGIAKNIAWYWSDLIQYRAQLSPSFARAANFALEVQHDLSLPQSARTDARMPHERLLEHKKLHEIEVLKGQSIAPAFLVQVPAPGNWVDFFSDVAQFRGPDDSTRLEISLLVPLQNIALQQPWSTPATIEYQGLIRNQAFDPVHLHTDTDSYSADYFQKFSNAIGELEFCTRPVQGDLTLQIRTLDSETIGYSKQPLVVRDFSSQQLMISDIRLFYAPDQFTGIPESVIRTINSVRVIPYPYEQIHPTLPVFCYFEIYNIITTGLREEFEVTIAIVKEKGRRGIFRQTMQWLTGAKAPAIAIRQVRSIRQDTERELIAIDLAKLKPGHYLLKIAVAGIDDPNRSATTQKSIRIAE